MTCLRASEGHDACLLVFSTWRPQLPITHRQAEQGALPPGSRRQGRLDGTAVLALSLRGPDSSPVSSGSSSCSIPGVWPFPHCNFAGTQSSLWSDGPQPELRSTSQPSSPDAELPPPLSAPQGITDTRVASTSQFSLDYTVWLWQTLSSLNSGLKSVLQPRCAQHGHGRALSLWGHSHPLITYAFKATIFGS